MNSHWLRAEREMSQIGRGSLNFRLAIGEMNFNASFGNKAVPKEAF